MQDTNLLADQPIAWTPTPDVIERAQLTKFMRQVGVSTWDELYQFSISDVEKFTEEVLRFLDIRFDPPYEKLLDTSNGIEFPTWLAQKAETRPVGSVRYAGLNITEMCIDRWQTDEIKDQPAVIWEDEAGANETLTYAQLIAEVEKCAAGLRRNNLGKGDAIGIHLPMIPEALIALLAINRIGAIAVPVFSGYGVEAIVSRMNAVGAKALFGCNGFHRRGKKIMLVGMAPEIAERCPSIKKVFVVDSLRKGFYILNPKQDPHRLRKVETVETVPGNESDSDLSLGGSGGLSFSITPDFDPAVLKRYNVQNWGHIVREPGDRVHYVTRSEPTSAEDPLIILYTSGTTGKPKGIAHTHASFPIKAAQDMAFGTDVGRGTRICWYTDIGWMMGPWLIYGALINGATICIYDGAPDYPTPDRMWDFCAKHKVEVLGISPTLIRALSNCGDDLPKKHDLSSLRMFASTGEPWNPAPWWWLFETVGDGKLPIINYSGGTEIAGGILMGNPLLPQKPCSFPAPCPGMDVDILNEKGESVDAGEVGELVIKQPWIGMARGFWQEKERYLETYWQRFKDIWVHGDWAMRDKDGHWFILGRSDDTLKVAGKRVGPAEVESLLVAHPLVIEAAVIGVPDEAKGTAMVAFVVRNADALVRNEGEARTTAATFANKKGWHGRGYLPHFDGVVSQFVTFRLADSLPQSVLRKLRTELESEEVEDKAREYRKRVESYLDKGIGECILRVPAIATVVEETLIREHNRTCDLIAWVIMPNHVHFLLRPLDGHSLSEIIKTIKSVSTRRINEKLGRSGSQWQPDYFDRYIRDADHFYRAVRYIMNNPVKAGLCSTPEEWRFSSAPPQAAIADEGVRVPLEAELKALVSRDMGKPLAPSKIHFVSSLPKTRNAKVMRRVIRAAYLGEDPGDLSALEDPRAVDEIRTIKGDV